MKKLAYLLVFVIVLTFCRGVSFAEPSPKLYKYTAVDLGIAKRHDIDECRIGQIVGDEVFFWTVHENEKHEFEKVEFYIIDIADGYKETKIPYSLEYTFVSDVYYSGEYIYVLYHDRNDYQCILKLDKEGKRLTHFLLNDNEIGQYLHTIFVSDDGRIFGSGRDGLSGYDAQGNKVWELERNGGFFSCAYDGADRLFCANSGAIYEVDANDGKLLKIKTGSDVTYARAYACGGRAYIINYGQVVKYEGDWNNLEKVVNFNDYYIDGSMYTFYADDDVVRFIDYDPFDAETKVLLHNINLREEGKPKKEIIIAVPDYSNAPNETDDIIYEFDRFSQDYVVLCTIYKSGGTIAEFREEFQPDIVLMPDTEIRAQIDMVADLMPYMKKSELLSLDTLTAAVSRNFTDNGAFYMLPVELSLDTFAVRKSDYDKDGFSTTDYFDYLKRDGALYTDYFLSKESVMKSVMDARLHEFVDYGNKTCSFNSSEFRKIVTKIDALSSDNYYYADATLAPIGEDDRLLDDSRISGLDFFVKKRAAYGGAVTAAGRPGKKGGVNVMSAMCMAICKDSDCIEGAFEFLEYFSSHYTGMDREGMLLANKAQFEKSAAAMAERGVLYDSFGETVLISADDIETIKEAIDNSVSPYCPDAEVMEYVTYYTDKYFDGEMTLTKALNELQSSVAKYLNE